CLVLSNHDSRDSIKKNGAAAHGARRERRIDRALFVDLGRLAAGIFQRIHLAVQYGTCLLNAPVVSSPDNLSLVHEDRADGDSSLTPALFGLFDGGLHELVSSFVFGAHQSLAYITLMGYIDQNLI